MKFLMSHESDFVLITIDEPVLREAHLRDISEKVAHFTSQGRSNFIVDMTELKLMDGRAVSTFVSCRLKAKSGSGDFVLANVSEYVMNLVGITNLVKVFTITKTVEEAQALFQSQLQRVKLKAREDL